MPSPSLRPDNPFSRFLRGRLDRPAPAADALLERWDRLEALVIRVYRAGRADAADIEDYARIRRWLDANYPPLAAGLEPHWRGARAGGAPVSADPLLAIYRHPKAEDFVGNWTVMQLLPAAREALNRWLRAGAGTA